MVIIIDKSEVTSRRGESYHQVTLENLKLFNIADGSVKFKTIQLANIFIVTDCSTNRMLIVKHRYNEHLQGAILSLGELERAIEDDIAANIHLRVEKNG